MNSFPAKPSTCFVSGYSFFKTFDGRFYNFPGRCLYELVADCTANQSYKVHVYLDPNCDSGKGLCKRYFKLYLGTEAEVKVDSTSVSVNNVDVTLPYSYKRFLVHRIGNYLLLDLRNGVQVQWDGHSAIYVTLAAHVQEKTCGLCGNNNGNKDDDFTTQQVRGSR